MLALAVVGLIWYAAIGYCVKSLLDVLHDFAVDHGVGVDHHRWEPWLLGWCWPLAAPILGLQFWRSDNARETQP